MKVARIAIRNILGIEELDIEPGSLTVVEGANGAGKTSTLEAIRSVIDGGHDATLLRAGADAGEVVLVLEDGTEMRKRITAKASTLTVTHPQTGVVGKPQSYVGRLTDALSVNPVAFLTAPPKKRAEYLLEAMPLRVTPEQIADAIDGDPAATDMLRGGPTEGHALEVIERFRKTVYEDRTGTNRAAKEKRATESQLSGSLPKDDRDAEALLEHVRTLRIERDAWVATHHEQVRVIDAEMNAEIDRIKDEARAAIEQVRSHAGERRNLMDTEEHGPRLEQIFASLTEAETLLKEAERHANTRTIRDGIAAEASALETRSGSLTRALDGLERLKGELLADLPIKGIEVRDGEVYHKGVPFDRMNRAEQVKLAIRVAQLRAGDLKLVCVDGLECLDRATFEAFARNAPRANLQFVVTRVGEGALSVATAEEEAHD